MSSQPKSHHSSINRSRTVPLSIFNKQLIEEASKISASKEHISRGYSGGTRGDWRKQNSHNRSVSTSAMSSNDFNRASKMKRTKRKTSEQQSSTSGNSCWTLPTGSELVSSKHPSSLGLPKGWNCNHDRFIAYLATHAPLDENGKIPKDEELEDRWKMEDIAREVMHRFPKLDCHIKPTLIEKRLIVLDQAGDNDYFKMPYGAYRSEEWGGGI